MKIRYGWVSNSSSSSFIIMSDKIETTFKDFTSYDEEDKNNFLLSIEDEELKLKVKNNEIGIEEVEVEYGGEDAVKNILTLLDVPYIHGE